MAGIRRAKGTASAAKAPAITEDIRRMVAAVPENLLGLRDRALLLVGFAGGFRRSELVGLDREDCEFTSDGVILVLRRSKTDQEGAGRKIAIPFGSNPDTCPVRGLKAWLDSVSLEQGPLFRPVSRHGQSPGSEAVRVCHRPGGEALRRWPQGSIRSSTAATACVPASPPPQQSTAPRSAPSWRRPATDLSPWCGGTSGTGTCSERMPRRSSASEMHRNSFARRISVGSSMTLLSVAHVYPGCPSLDGASGLLRNYLRNLSMLWNCYLWRNRLGD